ncbi:MAG: hypothetical protein ACI90V_012336 [Bacillariaceae sp.]|jgi:hypothetical protein
MSTNFEDDERFDGLYLNVAQTTRGIEPLLDSVFSFLRRKTDFFAGPPGADGPDGQAAAIAKVNDVLQKHANRYQEDIIAKKNKKKEKQQKQQSSKKAKSTTTTTTTVKQPFKITEPEDEEEIIEMGTDGEFDASTTTTASQKPVISPLGKSSTTVKPSKKEPPSKKEIPMKTDTTKDDDDDDDDGDKKEKKKEKGDGDGDGDGEDENDGPPPAGNGGTVPDKYVWTQTLAECIVTIPVPENTRGRDVQVTMSRSHLKVSLKNKQPQLLIVDDDFTKPIICDDSFWTIEDGNRLVINIQKLNQMEWWNSICKSDPIINVRQIRPENSNLGDLDGETRKTVEKMMFDQRQKGTCLLFS